jgi:hypothetical protein
MGYSEYSQGELRVLTWSPGVAEGQMRQPAWRVSLLDGGVLTGYSRGTHGYSCTRLLEAGDARRAEQIEVPGNPAVLRVP